jgi:hypothetical protein
MLYYQVKPKYAGCNHNLVRETLYTEKEIEKLGINKWCFIPRQISQRNIYWFFGCRFESGNQYWSRGKEYHDLVEVVRQRTYHYSYASGDCYNYVYNRLTLAEYRNGILTWKDQPCLTTYDEECLAIFINELMDDGVIPYTKPFTADDFCAKNASWNGKEFYWTI